MRKLTLVCLTVAALVGRTSYAVVTQPVQPASVQPIPARQVKYVYDPGEDLDEVYVYDADKDEEPAPAVAVKEKESEQQAAPVAPVTPITPPALVAPLPPAPLPPAVSVAAPVADKDPANVEEAYGASDSSHCDSCDNCSGGRSGWCDSVDGFTLDGALGWECCPYHIGGWTEMGYTSNNVPLSQDYNDLLSFSDVPDNVNLYQQWLYAEKTVDGSCGWDLGGRVDAIYGTDAQKAQSFGNPGAGTRGVGFFDASWDHGIYGFAMPQLYGEVAYHDLSVKIGHFFTPLGYEVIPATGNFFFTHSYTMFNSEPFTHTGALATYSGYDNVTLYGGWSLGWDTGFDQLDGGNNVIAGFSSTLADSLSFAYLCTAGNFGWRDGGSSGSYNHSIVLIADVSDDLQYVFQSDNLRTDNPGVSAYDTIGAVNYLFYKLNDTAKLGGRIEWWKADGVSYNEVTLGVNLLAIKNLVVRPEWRQDWAPGAGINEDTFSIDAVWSY